MKTQVFLFENLLITLNQMDYSYTVKTATTTLSYLTANGVNVVNEWFRLITFLTGAVVFFLALIVALKMFSK